LRRTIQLPHFGHAANRFTIRPLSNRSPANTSPHKLLPVIFLQFCDNLPTILNTR
jgi:hypothetical protein